ncbi:MAG: VWA domain-containing protein [Candidatus Sabulitectum sp.]|nr:VWA domain-containing protein [Candidatus Sabulitectum sp.]
MIGAVLGLSALLMVMPSDDYSRMIVMDDEGIVSDLPLEHTEAHITVDGSIQLVTVRQVYGNPYSHPIEAVYVFPLPESGAVYSMDMEIGDRRIEGEIKERLEAQRIYEEAISQGRTAALLEQERPNIFTQTVGNILPGDDIVIEIMYAAPVEYDGGNWEVVYPMVVGPRFSPNGVSDVNRITPDIVPEDTRSGYDIELSLTLDPGFPIREFESLNHAVRTEIRDNDKLYVELSREHEIPNRDFVFTYRTAGNDIGAGVVSHNGEMGGHFMLMLEPDADVDPGDIAPKEIFFVVDNSGSMSGQPMEVAKETVRQFVRGMNPDDSFQIMRFSETASSMSSEPMENTTANVRRGIEYINSMAGMGGTMMIEGVRACVGYPEDPERMRYIIFLTDGYIGNELEILSELRTTLGEHTRLFSIGVGSSVNRYLIEGLAEEGRGYAVYVGLDQNPKSAVEDVYNKINNPYLVNIEIDWGNLDVREVYPREIRDLYDGEPLVVVGRYGDSGRDEITITGTLNGRNWERSMNVRLVSSGGSEAADRLWARRKIHHLNRLVLDSGYRGKRSDGLIEAIIGVSLDYGVLCEQTAFVAVDSYVRTDGSSPETVGIPVNMPEGVSYTGIFGGIAAQTSSSTSMYRSIAPAPAAYGSGTAGGGSLMNGFAVSGEVQECCDQTAYEHIPVYSATLGGVSDYLGARPSQFRSVILELIDELNADSDILGPGEIRIEITVNSSGVITGIRIMEDTVEIDEVAEIVENFLLGETIQGASTGTSTVTIVF